jgi:AcrR family transcriptional regulator
VSGLARSSKRELLLGAATRLFAERTYASVSMEEVAAEVGLSASTVYHHFASKLDVLVTLLTRGSAYLQVALDEVLATAAGPAEALRGLVTSYGRFAVAHPQLVDILITEARTMPEKEAAAMVETQRDYVSEWVHLLRQFHGGVDDTTARVQVQAALMVMNNLARHPSLRGRPGADRVLSSLADRVLDLT